MTAKLSNYWRFIHKHKLHFHLFERRNRKRAFYVFFISATLLLILLYLSYGRTSEKPVFNGNCFADRKNVIVAMAGQRYIMRHNYTEDIGSSDWYDKWLKLPSVIKTVWAPIVMDLKWNFYTNQTTGRNITFVDFLDKKSPCNIATISPESTIDVRWSTGRPKMPIEQQISKKYPQCDILRLEAHRHEYDPLAWIGIVKIFILNRVAPDTFCSIGTCRNAQAGPDDLVLFGAESFRGSAADRAELIKLMLKPNGDRPIDILLVDHPGLEYIVLEYLAENLDKMAANLCQIDIVFRRPSHESGYTLEQFFEKLHQFLQRDQFAVLKANIDEDLKALNFFFLNVRNEHCMRKFSC
ncbi:hypothetical protein Ddc_18351 [Ditylenchus destructor]|nr:hypothetical protein Ddc_18351 [Ditylenchus destructor]